MVVAAWAGVIMWLTVTPPAIASTGTATAVASQICLRAMAPTPFCFPPVSYVRSPVQSSGSDDASATVPTSLQNCP